MLFLLPLFTLSFLFPLNLLAMENTSDTPRDLGVIENSEKIRRGIKRKIMHYSEGELREKCFRIRGATAQESFSHILDLSNRMAFLKNNNFKVSFPGDSRFFPLYKQGKVPRIEEDKLRYIFYTEIYREEDFEKGLEVIAREKHIINAALEKMPTLARNWKFKVMPFYDIVIGIYTLHGHGFFDDGTIYIRTDREGTFRDNAPSHTIVHTMIHTGIHHLVEKFHLFGSETERLVDLICSLYFTDELPGYRVGDQDSKIDAFITREIIEKDLVGALQKFIEAYPRS